MSLDKGEPESSSVIQLRIFKKSQGYSSKKPFVFALSPLRLAQGSADIPPSQRGAMSVVSSFVFKLTAEISVCIRISVIQATVDG